MKTLQELQKELQEANKKLFVKEPLSGVEAQAYLTKVELDQLTTSTINATLAWVREIVENLKYEDPRVKGHKLHPTEKWTDCEACRENFAHNQALTNLLNQLEDKNNN